jgi:hypothetical protein
MIAAAQRLLAYDSRLSRVLMAAFWWFITSVQFLVTALPFAFVDHASGGESTHAAIWLGAISALPIGPGAYAALSCMRESLAEPGYPGAPFGRFWRAWSQGWKRLWRLWAGASVMGLLLAYNAALYGSGDAAFIGVAIGAVLLLVAVTAASSAALAGAEGPTLAVLTAGLRAAALRPQAPIAWLALAALAYGAAHLPVVGANLALFTPAGCACAILIVNAATGFDRKAAGSGSAVARSAPAPAARSLSSGCPHRAGPSVG